MQQGLQYLVCHSVRLSVCYYIFCNYTQQGSQKAIQMGSAPHWLDFKNGDLCTSTACKSYGVKTKPTSQYANEHCLPRPDSAHFKHCGGSTSNTKGEYVVLVCKKTRPTDVASTCVHCFRETSSCISVPHAYFSCTRMYVYSIIMYTHELTHAQHYLLM